MDICGECDVTEPGNSALNDMANAALLEFFTSADVTVRILRKTKTGQQEETDEKMNFLPSDHLRYMVMA